MLLTIFLIKNWTKLPQDIKGIFYEAFAYGGTWSQFLDRIEEALPKLEEFRFDCNKRYGYSLKDRDGCGARMYPQRYMGFDDGPFPEANDSGEMYVHFLEEGTFTNMYKGTLEADQKSLDRLMDTVKSRR